MASLISGYHWLSMAGQTIGSMETTNFKIENHPGIDWSTRSVARGGGNWIAASDAAVIGLAHLLVEVRSDECAGRNDQRNDHEAKIEVGHSDLLRCGCEIHNRPTARIRPRGVRNAAPSHVGAKFLDGYGASGSAFNGHTVLETRNALFIGVLPLTNLRIARHLDTFAKFGDGERAGAFEVVVQVHENRVYSNCYVISIAIASIATAIVDECLKTWKS